MIAIFRHHDGSINTLAMVNQDEFWRQVKAAVWDPNIMSIQIK